MRKKYMLLAAVAVASLGEVVPAFAQDAEGGAYVENGDIIVTAREREESILKVPVVTNSLSSEQIQRAQITDIRRVAEQVPGFIVGQGSSAAYGAQLSLRGIGTSVLNGTIDQSISLNLDGQQFTQGLAFTAAMFDLQQLTVLKGPQALFFGKASPAGVVAIQSANPTPDWQIIGRAGYEFEARAKQGELIVSGPLANNLGMRLAGRYTQSDGYFHNIAVPTPGLGGLQPESRAPHNKETILRGTLLWEPTDTFSARLKVTYSDSNVRDQAGQLASCPDGLTGPQGIQYIALNDGCKIDRNFTQVDMDPKAFPAGVTHNGQTFAHIEQTFGVLELNARLSPEIKATSVTGYYDVNEEDQFNAAQSGAAGPVFDSHTKFNRETFTQELRLTSDFTTSPVNFTLGAFYENTRQFKHGFAGLNQNLGLPLNFLPNSQLLSNGTHNNPIESESVFGQLLWKITPQLEIAGGARWTHDERSHTYYNLITHPERPINLLVPELKSNRVSPELTITYTPTDDLTIFGALKKGYKSGSFNSSGTFSDGSDTSFKDEKVEGGELGLKARLFDRALTFNLSGYYYKYDGLQVGATAQASDSTISIQILNAASAKIYGLEGDLTYRPPSVDGLTLRLAASWNHARYGTFDNAPCWGGQLVSQGCNLAFSPAAKSSQTVAGPIGGIFMPDPTNRAGGVTIGGVYGFWGYYSAQNLSGRELLRSPDFTATGGIDYEMPVGKGMKLQFGTSMRYSSRYYSDIVLRSDEIQSAYAKINGNITLQGPEDRWELSLIGNNITDHLIQNKCSGSNAANGVNPLGAQPLKGGTALNVAGVEEIICTIDPGREVWLRATFKL